MIPSEASKWMKEVTGNIDLWNRRAQLGLDVLKGNTNVDVGKLAAVGSSFGGATALQMAYAGHDVKAVVSIASALFPAPESVTTIKPRVLVFHGPMTRLSLRTELRHSWSGSIALRQTGRWLSIQELGTALRIQPLTLVEKKIWPTTKWPPNGRGQR